MYIMYIMYKCTYRFFFCSEIHFLYPLFGAKMYKCTKNKNFEMYIMYILLFFLFEMYILLSEMYISKKKMYNMYKCTFMKKKMYTPFLSFLLPLAVEIRKTGIFFSLFFVRVASPNVVCVAAMFKPKSAMQMLCLENKKKRKKKQRFGRNPMPSLAIWSFHHHHSNNNVIYIRNHFIIFIMIYNHLDSKFLSPEGLLRVVLTYIQQDAGRWHVPDKRTRVSRTNFILILVLIVNHFINWFVCFVFFF